MRDGCQHLFRSHAARLGSAAFLTGAVTTGKVDMAISGFAYTEERAESMELSDFFNMDNDDGQGLLVLKEQADQYTKAEDFAGKKVAVQNASLQFNLLTSQLPEAKPELITNQFIRRVVIVFSDVDYVIIPPGGFALNAKTYADNIHFSGIDYERLLEMCREDNVSTLLVTGDEREKELLLLRNIRGSAMRGRGAAAWTLGLSAYLIAGWAAYPR